MWVQGGHRPLHQAYKMSKPSSEISYLKDNDINDDVDNNSSVIQYVFNNSMTMMELMNALQELIERFPFCKDYKVNHVEFGSLTRCTVVEIDKNKGLIIIC